MTDEEHPSDADSTPGHENPADEALPPDVELRPATMSEVDALADMWVDLAADQRRHGSHVLPADNRTGVRDSIGHRVASDGAVVAVANEAAAPGERSDDDSEPPIVGFVSFGPETDALATDVDRGLVENVYVVPERRGEGIGTALVRAAERSLFAAGADAVRLEAMAANEAARRFYEALGYEEHRVEYVRSRDEGTGEGSSESGAVGAAVGDDSPAGEGALAGDEAWFGTGESDTHTRED